MFKESIRKSLKKLAFEDPKGTLIKAFIIFMLISSIIYYGVITIGNIYKLDINATLYGGLLLLIFLVLICPLILNLTNMFLKNSQDELISVSDLFKFKKNIFKFTGYYTLIFLIYFLARFILNYIPVAGFIISLVLEIVLFPIFLIVPFAFLDNEDDSFIELIKKTIKLLKNHMIEFYGLLLSFILWFTLGFFTLGLLYIWLIPYMLISFSYFYQYIKGKKEFQKQKSLSNISIILITILSVATLDVITFINNPSSFDNFKEQIGLTTITKTDSVAYGSYKVYYKVPKNFELSNESSFTKTYKNENSVLQYTIYLSTVNKVKAMDKEIVEKYQKEKTYDSVIEKEFTLKTKDKNIQGYKYVLTKDKETLTNTILYYKKGNYVVSISLTSNKDLNDSQLKKYVTITS